MYENVYFRPSSALADDSEKTVWNILVVRAIYPAGIVWESNKEKPDWVSERNESGAGDAKINAIEWWMTLVSGKWNNINVQKAIKELWPSTVVYNVKIRKREREKTRARWWWVIVKWLDVSLAYTQMRTHSNIGMRMSAISECTRACNCWRIPSGSVLKKIQIGITL